MTRHGIQHDTYGHLLATGRRRLETTESAADPLQALVEEFQQRRATGEKLSIRQFCGEHRLSQKQFEARMRPPSPGAALPAAAIAYYQRAEVQQALFAWAQGRRVALHYAQDVIRLGFRAPADVALLAAASNMASPTFHASVGRYSGTQLVAFELVAEVDFKGDWRTCFQRTRPLVHALAGLQIPFLVKFSGHSSAHVIVPCRGGSYGQAAEAFLRRLPGSMRGSNRLDLSFRHPQHFLRMPYALHERTGLVSLPLTPEEFDTFDPEQARPENVSVDPACIAQVLTADNLPWLSGCGI